MKFILDMGISPRVLPWLSDQGHDAIHVMHHNPEASDPEILALAAQMGAVIITSDKDFCDLLARLKAHGPSMILFRTVPAPPEVVIEGLSEALESHGSALVSGCIVTIALGRSRARSLPIVAPSKDLGDNV